MRKPPGRPPPCRLNIRFAGHHAGIFRNALGDLLTGFGFLGVCEVRLAIDAKRESVLDRCGLRRPGLNQGCSECAPLQLHPDAALDGVEMQAWRVIRRQVQPRLDAVEHLVREGDAAVDAVFWDGWQHQHRPARAFPLRRSVGDDHVLRQLPSEDAISRMKHALRIRFVRHCETRFRVDEEHLAIELLAP